MTSACDPTLVCRRASVSSADQRSLARHPSSVWSGVSGTAAVTCSRVSGAPKVRLSQSAHFRARPLCGPRSTAQSTWRISTGRAAVSAICTPVHTGHSASCSTLAVLEPRMKRRNSPQPWVGMTKKWNAERGIAVQDHAAHVAPGEFRLLKPVQLEGQTLDLGAVQVTQHDAAHLGGAEPVLHGGQYVQQDDFRGKALREALGAVDGSDGASRKVHRQQDLRNRHHGLPPWRRTATAPHRLPYIRVIPRESPV